MSFDGYQTMSSKTTSPHLTFRPFGNLVFDTHVQLLYPTMYNSGSESNSNVGNCPAILYILFVVPPVSEEGDFFLMLLH